MQQETTEILSIATELSTSARRRRQLSYYYLVIPSRSKDSRYCREGKRERKTASEEELLIKNRSPPFVLVRPSPLQTRQDMFQPDRQTFL